MHLPLSTRSIDFAMGKAARRILLQSFFIQFRALE